MEVTSPRLPFGLESSASREGAGPGVRAPSAPALLPQTICAAAGSTQSQEKYSGPRTQRLSPDAEVVPQGEAGTPSAFPNL